MKIQIPIEQFSRAIRAVKPALSKDSFQPILQYISVKVFETKITFFACDGYRALRYTMPNTTDYKEKNNPLSFCIVPVPVNVKKFPDCLIDIDVQPTATFVTVPSQFGKLTYQIDNTQSYPASIDQDKLLTAYPDNTAASIYLNPCLLSSALTGFVASTKVKLSVPMDKYSPVRVVSSNDDSEFVEAVVLPVRIFTTDEEKFQ